MACVFFMSANPEKTYTKAAELAGMHGTGKVMDELAVASTSATASENLLEPGKVYAGTVVSLNMALRTMEVTVGSQRLANCIYASGELASFFGLGECGMPMLGAAVNILYMGSGSAPVVIGAMGALHMSAETGRSSLTGNVSDSRPGREEAFKPNSKNAEPIKARKGTSPPVDLLPGEMYKTSGLGSVLKLLYNFASLSASECAKVEACILNDMVRIVDNYFVHHTCGGDQLIWTSGGRCTGEEHFTSYLYEAEGKISKEEPLASGAVAEFNYDTPTSVENVYSDTGRWRMSQYWGFLGDMVHRWVTTPTDVASNIMEKSFRAGQYRSWVGSDGSLCIQSAGGVQIEVTQNIVIPAILKAWNQPDFDMAKAMEDLNDEFLQMWGSGPDWKDLTVAVWQLRYYAKYMALWHSLARFRQLKEKGYCDIPIESEAPERTPAAGEEDRAAVDTKVEEPRKHHAMLSMDMGGGVALTSQGHTSVILSNGSVQIACPGNLELKAGGTVSIQGKNVAITGGQIVEISSLFGSLSMKARTLLQALCEAGVLWLKGDAKENSSPPADPLESDMEPVFRDYSIVLDASEGKTLVHGATGVTVGSTEAEANINIQTLGKDSGVHVMSRKDITLQARTGMIISLCKNWICQAMNIGLYGSKVIKLGTQVAIKKGVLHAMLIYAQLAAAYGSFIGRSRFVAEVDDIEPYKPDTKTEELDAIKAEGEEKAQAALEDDFQQKEFGAGAAFKLAEWDKEFSSDIENMLSLKRSFYEEEAKAEPEQEDGRYIVVQPSEAKLMPAKRTEPSVPFPGQFVKRFEFTAELSGKLLGDAWTADFTAGDIKTSSDMTPGQYTYVFYKSN